VFELDHFCKSGEKDERAIADTRLEALQRVIGLSGRVPKVIVGIEIR
jgi:hypothetical protein